MSALTLDIRSEGQLLKLSASKPGERTVTYFEEKKINPAEVSNLCQQIMNLLDKATYSVVPQLTGELQNLGLSLYDQLLTQRIKEKLQNAGEHNLILRLDENLVYIPWELLYDGQEFFCLRFSLGRMVYTRLAGVEHSRQKMNPPLKVLIVADPRNDLEAAYREGNSLMEMLNRSGRLVKTDFKSTKITPQALKLCIRDYDILHYAGHAEYDPSAPLHSGWLMAQGKLGAEDIITLGNASKPMPALVFANACQSGNSAWKIDEGSNRQIFGLANAFLLAGVGHYIGTCRDILDEHSAYFARIFYQNLLNGDSTGEALRKARLEILGKFGGGAVLWASYLLYGDPGTKYVTEEKPLPAEVRGTPAMAESRGIQPQASKWGLGRIVLMVMGILTAVAVTFIHSRPGIPPVAPGFIPGQSADDKPRFIPGQTSGVQAPALRNSKAGTPAITERKPKETALLKSGLKNTEPETILAALPNWPMFRRDAAHSAGRGAKLSFPLRLRWKFAASGRVRGGAALLGNALYIGSGDDCLYALDIQSGKLLWKYRTEGDIFSSPALAGKQVYLSSGDGYIYAIDFQNNGVILWRQKLDSGSASSPAIDLEAGRLYAGTNSGNLYVLDISGKEGRIAGRFATQGNISSSPVIYNGKAYVGSGDGGLYCLNDGQFKKIYQTTGGIPAAPLIDHGVVYIGSEDESLYALTEDGQLRWRCREITGEIAASPVLAENKLFVGTTKGYFYSIGATGGQLNWQVKLGGPVFTAPVVSRNLIFIGCDDGNIYVLRMEDGSTADKFHIGSKIRSSPILAEDVLYFGADDNYVYALCN